MNQLTVLKCPSCGSSVIETENQNIAVCSHCGSKLLFKSKKTSSLIIQHSKLLISLFVLTVAIAIVGFYLYPQQSIKPNIKIITKPSKTATPIAPINFLTVSNKSEIKPGENLKNSDLSNKPDVIIIHKVQGKTSNGGIYWIVTLRNNSNQTIYRPGAIVSLFDENNKRVEEQKGWSKQTQLEPGTQTDALLYISHPPEVNYNSQLKGTGSFSTFFTNTRKIIEIVDFIVKPKAHNPIHSNIIGDVKNTHDFPVEFIRVVAVAKDANNKSIGLADGFVSSSSLESQAQSGFKLRAGTFITEKPVTWTLFAFGQKHRDKL